MSEILNDAILVDAIRAQISAEVVKTLTPDVQASILAKGIAEVLSSYSWKTSIEREINELTRSHLGEYLKTPEVQDRIRAAAVEAVEKYVGVFQAAVLQTLFEATSSRLEYSSDKFSDALAKQLGTTVKRTR